MLAFEGLQIKSKYLPIDIWLTVNEVTNMLKEKKPQHVLFPQKIIRDAGNVRSNLSNSLITFYECLDIVNISINSNVVFKLCAPLKVYMYIDPLKFIV